MSTSPKPTNDGDHGRPPTTEVVIDGKRWLVVPSGFGYDDGSQSCRLVPVEVQVDEPRCSCENPKPGAHAQSCPRFGMNP